MEQRPLRLGDILDDYCPRERRVTNHAVVAMIEDTVKQTRCTTCDAEHPYKGGQAPRRRKKSAASTLYKEVLAGRLDAGDAAAEPPRDEEPTLISSAAASGAETDTTDTDTRDNDHEGVETPIKANAPLEAGAPINKADAPINKADAPRDEADATVDDPTIQADSDDRAPDVEDGPVHRPLIRATLPRPEGQKDVRTPPDFTIRQAGGRGNNTGNFFRQGNSRTKTRGGGGGHSGNGHRPQGGPRFAGARPGHGPGHGQGRGQGGGFRSAQQPRHGGGGRKRSR